MSETATPAVGAASLYPVDGGAAAAAAASTLPAGTGTDTVAATGGTDTVVAGAGTDTVAAGAGTDTVAGNDTAAGADTTSGTDTNSGTDSLSAASYDFTLPAGFSDNVELTSEAKTVMAAAGVAPDKAQGLIDLFGKAVKANADAQVAAHTTQQQAWLTEIGSMPEFTGPTRETSLASIGKLFDEFGTPEAKTALNAYGVGNNPALVKMMLKIASVVNEGGPSGGGRPVGTPNGKRAPATVGQSLYPDAGKTN